MGAAYGAPAPPPPRITTFPRSATTTYQPTFLLSAASFSADSLDDDVDYSVKAFEESADLTTLPPTCDGSISLHDKTYLRGLNITVTDDMDDLTVSPSRISQRLTSLEVQGDCCWTVFTETSFGGESKRFSPGASKSAANMGAVFRAAGSVRKSVC